MEAEKAMISATFFDGGREGAALSTKQGDEKQCPAHGRGMPWRDIGASRCHFYVELCERSGLVTRLETKQKGFPAGTHRP